MSRNIIVAHLHLTWKKYVGLVLLVYHKILPSSKGGVICLDAVILICVWWGIWWGLHDALEMTWHDPMKHSSCTLLNGRLKWGRDIRKWVHLHNQGCGEQNKQVVWKVCSTMHDRLWGYGSGFLRLPITHTFIHVVSKPPSSAIINLAWSFNKFICNQKYIKSWKQ